MSVVVHIILLRKDQIQRGGFDTKIDVGGCVTFPNARFEEHCPFQVWYIVRTPSLVYLSIYGYLYAVQSTGSIDFLYLIAHEHKFH